MAFPNPIRFVKNWLTGTRSREENWDEIANKISTWATETNNHLKQIALDLNGATYVFNGDGRATQTTSIVARLTTLEATINTIGTRNLGLDLSDTTKIAL